LLAVACILVSAIPAAPAKEPWEATGWRWLDHVGKWQWFEANTSAYTWGTLKGIASVEFEQDTIVAKLMLDRTLHAILRATLHDKVVEQRPGFTKTMWRVTSEHDMFEDDKNALEGTYVIQEYSGTAYEMSGVRTFETLLVTDEYGMIGLTRVTQ
jgi:hypothetical protein